MPIVKAVKDKDPNAYNQMSDLKAVISYIMNPNKCLLTDSLGHPIMLLSGFTDFIPEELQHDPNIAFDIMSTNKQLHHQSMYKLLKHRVISFENDEYITPMAVYTLGKIIMSFYFSYGYIGCFGVHMDSDNIHLHYCIDTMNVFNGNRFYLYKDLDLILGLVNNWFRSYRQANADPWDIENRILFERGMFKAVSVNDCIPRTIEKASQLFSGKHTLSSQK